MILTAREVIGADAGDSVWTWLPNSLVGGVVGETPPLKLIRQTFNLNALSLLIDIYDTQSLNDFGGVHWQHIQQNYQCKKWKNKAVACFGALRNEA